jgi:hypothetical protein
MLASRFKSAANYPSAMPDANAPIPYATPISQLGPELLTARAALISLAYPIVLILLLRSRTAKAYFTSRTV